MSPRCSRGCCSVLLLLLLLLIIPTTTPPVYARSLDSADQRWRDWLLVEDTAPSDVASAPGGVVRRITPKSVFVAPNFNPGCREGQQVDSQGRCVQIVKVDQAAHLDFLLKRFNSMFAPAPPPSKKVEKDSSGPFHVSLPLGGAEKPETPRPQTATTTQTITTTALPQLTTTKPPKTTTEKTDTTTITMPPSTSFSSAIDSDATTELLNFSDESTTSRVTHETIKPSTFFSHSANPTFMSSPITTQVDETWSSHRIQTLPPTGSHRPTDTEMLGMHRPQSLPTTQTDVFGSHSPQTLPTYTETIESHRTQTNDFGSHKPTTLDVFGSHEPHTLPTTHTDVFGSRPPPSLPTTFNTQNPDFLFAGVHRTRPSSLQTSTTPPHTGEDLDKTVPFPSHTTLFSSPTLQTIQPFEGIHRTRPSSLHTTFPAPPTVKTNEVFTLKGFQRTTPSASHLSFTTTTSATTTFGDATLAAPNGDDEHLHQSPHESLIFSGDSDNKKPFVIIVANNTFKRQEPSFVTDDADYDSTTESTTSSIPESTTVLSHTVGNSESLESPTTESTADRFEYFSSVLTPPPTVDDHFLDRFPAVEEVPSGFDASKDALDVAESFQQMNSPGNTRTKCDSSYEVSQVRDGRIISQISVTNCQPESGGLKTTTTPQPPIRTVAPTTPPTQSTNFRFPLESQSANRPSYIRFPELPTASNYNTKLWGSENSNYAAYNNKNQQLWSQQSSLWNPFPSSVVRGWPMMDRSQISSNVYRKQYYQHPVPQWMNKNPNQYSWPLGRV